MWCDVAHESPENFAVTLLLLRALPALVGWWFPQCFLLIAHVAGNMANFGGHCHKKCSCIRRRCSQGLVGSVVAVVMLVGTSLWPSLRAWGAGREGSQGLGHRAESHHYEWAARACTMSSERRKMALAAMPEEDRIFVQQIIDEAENSTQVEGRHGQGGRDATTSQSRQWRDEPDSVPPVEVEGKTEAQRLGSAGLTRDKERRKVSAGKSGQECEDNSSRSASQYELPQASTHRPRTGPDALQRAPPRSQGDEPAGALSAGELADTPSLQPDMDKGLAGASPVESGTANLLGFPVSTDSSSIQQEAAAAAALGGSSDFLGMAAHSPADPPPFSHRLAEARSQRVAQPGVHKQPEDSADLLNLSGAVGSSHAAKSESSAAAVSGLDELMGHAQTTHGAALAGGAMIDFGDEAGTDHSALYEDEGRGGAVTDPTEPAVRAQLRAARLAARNARMRAGLAEKQVRCGHLACTVKDLVHASSFVSYRILPLSPVTAVFQILPTLNVEGAQAIYKQELLA